MGYTIPIFEKDEEYPYELVLEWFSEYMLSQKKKCHRIYYVLLLYKKEKFMCVCLFLSKETQEK